MTPNVNLLPSNYRQARMRHQRLRLGAMTVCMLLVVELFVGLLLHTRAGRVRDLLTAADAARGEIRSVKQKMRSPIEESATLAQQLALARRLRTTHYWSRLLGVFALASASDTTLTAIATDPPKWTPALGAAETPPAQANSKNEPPRVLEGLTIHGCSDDHEDVGSFVRKLQSAKAFASVNLLEARRDKYLDRDVISFEVQCRW